MTLAAGIGAGIDALADTAIVGAEVSAETTVEATEVAEVTETAVAEGESTAAAEEEAAKTSLRQQGKTVKGLIDDAKKILNKAKDDPIKVVPMPKSIIPAICDNITAYQAQNPLTGFVLERCDAKTAAKNRKKSIADYLENPVRGGKGIGLSLDEYPFASSIQGGVGARITPVPFWQNCVQGGIISACYSIEGIKANDPETPYTVIVIP